PGAGHRDAMGSSPVAGQQGGPGLTLADQVSGIDGDILVAIDPARGPGHLDRDGPPAHPEAEVQPGVGRGLVAPPAESPADLAPAAVDDLDAGADRIPGRGSPLQPDGDEPAAVRPVAEEG